MRAEVVVRLDRRGVDAHDHDRLIADFVDAVVAGLRDLVEARGDLPDFAPEFLELELRESGIDVTTDADAMRHRAPAWRPVAVAAGLRRTPCVDGETHDHRSEEHTSELQSLMRISYAVFCLHKKTTITCSRQPHPRPPMTPLQ